MKLRPHYYYGSLGTLPGRFDSSQGLRSQNSSLIISTWHTASLAFAFCFLSLSSWAFDFSATPVSWSSSVALVVCVEEEEGGVASSY